MTQVNKLLKALITTSLVFGAYACNDSKTVEEYQTEAKAFIQADDQKSAIIALKNANAIDSSNAQLRFDLGMLYLSEGDYLGAEKELEKAEVLGFDVVKVTPELIEVKFKLNKFDDVYTLTESAQSLSDNAYVKALTYAGLSSLYEKKRSDASDYIDRANAISSESVYGQIGKAYLADSDVETKEALRVVDNLIAYAPDITDSYLLKGYLLQGAKEHLEAAEAFQQYAQFRPKEYQIQFFIAQNYISGSALDKAEPIIDGLLKQVSRHPLANQMKAQIEFQRENFESAKSYAITAYQQNNNLTAAAIIAGMSSYYLENYEQAYTHLIKVKSLVSSEHPVNVVLIELQLRLGYNNDAIGTINELISDGNANTSLLTAASHELLKSGDKAGARELLQESIKLNSTDADQIASQGVMKLKLNDLGGIEMLEKALAINPLSEKAESGLAVGYVNNEQYEEALVIAKKWQLIDDKKIRGLLLESEVESKRGNIEAAKKILNNVLAEDENNLLSLLRLAIYEHKDKSYVSAFNLYKKVIDIDSIHPRATRGIIGIAYRDEAIANSAIDFYQQKIVLLPENNLLKLNLAYLYVTQKQTDKALTLLKALKASPSNNIEGIDLVIGDIYASLNDWRTSLKHYLAVTEEKPNSLKAASKLYSNYENLSKLDQALSEVNRIHAIYPDNLGLLLIKVNYQSRLKIKLNDNDIEVLKNNSKTANHSVFNKALGNAAFLKGDMVLASNYYKKAYESEPSSSNAIALSRSIARSESVDASISLLKEHLSDTGNNDVAVQLMLANAYLNKKDLTIAELIYLDVIETLPEDIISLNNLSYIYKELNRVEESLAFAEKVIKLKPNAPSIIDTYGQALLLDKQASLALKQFNKVLALLPDNTTAAISKGKALIQLGNMKEAKTVLSNIDTDNEDENKEIEILLDTL